MLSSMGFIYPSCRTGFCAAEQAGRPGRGPGLARRRRRAGLARRQGGGREEVTQRQLCQLHVLLMAKCLTMWLLAVVPMMHEATFGAALFCQCMLHQHVHGHTLNQCGESDTRNLHYSLRLRTAGSSYMQWAAEHLHSTLTSWACMQLAIGATHCCI